MEDGTRRTSEERMEKRGMESTGEGKKKRNTGREET